MDSAIFQQTVFVGVNDDGNESGSTSIVSDSATLSDDANADWTQLVDANFRIRVIVKEVAGIAEANFKEVWQFQINGGGWLGVTTLTGVKSVASAQFAGPVDTTQRLGSGTFLGTNSGLIENNSGGGPGSSLVPDYAGSDEAEFEICLQIDSGSISDGDTVEVKVTNNSSDLGAYLQTPSITVSEPAPPSSRRIFVVS